VASVLNGAIVVIVATEATEVTEVTEATRKVRVVEEATRLAIRIKTTPVFRETISRESTSLIEETMIDHMAHVAITNTIRRRINSEATEAAEVIVATEATEVIVVTAEVTEATGNLTEVSSIRQEVTTRAE